MEYGGGLRDRVGLPEDRDEEFDERALERAIRDNRRRELEALAQLNN